MTILKKILFQIAHKTLVVALAIVFIFIFYFGVGNLLNALLL